MNHVLLHLCYDNPFIDQSGLVFDHFYPNQNYFCVVPGGNKKKITQMRNAIWLDGTNPDVKVLQSLCEEKKVDVIILHGLSTAYIKILKAINPEKKYRVFWLFYGYELYNALGEKTDYPLIDSKSFFSICSWISPTNYNYWLRKILNQTSFYELLQESLPLIDYFCFWLYEDYLLLKKYFEVDLQFRFFQYWARYNDSQEDTLRLHYEKTPFEIRIGHSASLTENQDTVIKLLKDIDKDNVYRKVFPLSYGSVYMRKHVMKLGRRYFGNQFVPILAYTEREKYFESLFKTGVAIMGQNRQEATGNIVPLLRSGAKVFLRDNNVLLNYYKEKGYIIYSVEKDLKSLDDLQPLTRPQMEHNAEVGKKTRVFYEDFMPHLFDD